MGASTDSAISPNPIESLTSIGFTTREAKAFLARIENSYSAKVKPTPVRVVRYSEQRHNSRRAWVKGTLVAVWGYAFAVWLYVIAMQLRYANSVYWPLAVWVPIRMDYLGEAAFLLSFLVAINLVVWNSRHLKAISPVDAKRHLVE